MHTAAFSPFLSCARARCHYLTPRRDSPILRTYARPARDSDVIFAMQINACAMLVDAVLRSTNGGVLE